MDANTSESDERSIEPKPRRPFVLTGERLGNKVQLAQALLKAGATITKTAKDLGISRHSVQAIAGRLRTPGVAAHSGVQQEFDTYVRGDLRRVAKLSLENITPEKAHKASLRDLSFAADKTLARLEAIEGRSSNLDALAQIAGQFGLQPSHSASRVTLEQKITVETQHRPTGDP